MNCFLVPILALLTALQTAVADNAPARPAAVESLGPGLLEDLAPHLGQPPGSQTPENADQTQPSASEPSAPSLRLDDAGEDIAQSAVPLSLVRVRQAMQQAKALLAVPAIDPATARQAAQTQQQALDHLDKLIAELSNPSRGGQEQANDQPPNSSHDAQAQSPAADTSPGHTAAPESTTRLGTSDTVATEKVEFEQFVKRLWGHLPPRRREQMRQAFSEQFLPKYESEIQQYYRRLSETNDEPGTP
jgi:hypothetical protein